MTQIFRDNQQQHCETWGAMEAVQRSIILTEACRKLAAITSNPDKAQRLFTHILNQAEHLDQINRLSGATGETNDLYFAPRGKVMIVGTDQADSVPVLGQLVAALLAGNEVILRYQRDEALCDQAITILQQAGVLEGVMSTANDAELVTLLHIYRLAVVGLVGSLDEAVEVGQELAQSDGIITQLVAVTDMAGCHEMFEPEYIERFTTERVKTVNTTAIGGNASLIELGMG
ncbi:1-pyrroline-5-carboxylate dehydrogenase [Psychrobacter sp. FDAARGOS_221]|uniref:1-pyrroline-5-carboxylate dehydrogenase n=1 Tax=Psychrobacter sp. FDAARGOS_221 TaxID=1975705 RepID=UPI000BB5670C|nr:1-pyrroline-5-carboxylate dehydrogenase [Psychrobacter sp. FDAARGOS_221]PNK59881.1 1-pyrroline-5-carboxylate dehydrogenase [Psychrobacter sp. FDAARGOS_221]